MWKKIGKGDVLKKSNQEKCNKYGYPLFALNFCLLVRPSSQARSGETRSQATTSGRSSEDESLYQGPYSWTTVLINECWILTV